MNLAWSVLALVLVGLDDSLPKKPEPPSSTSQMTLADAIRIAFDNGEIVRVIACGAHGMPIDGVEPTPSTSRADAEIVGAASLLEYTVDSAEIVCPPAPRLDGVRLQSPIRNGVSLKTHIAPFLSNLGAPAYGETARPTKGPESNRAPTVIARLNADASLFRVKAEVMARVRSVKEQYWNLAQAHAQLEAAEQAAALTSEILKKEQVKQACGRGTVADVAEVSQRLEQLNLDVVTRTSDVISTERQLRNLLGLPAADSRRVIPVTPPTDAQVEFDWDTCFHEMVEYQPDIVQQRILTRLAELQLLVARNQLLPELNLIGVYNLNGLGQELDGGEGFTIGLILNALKPIVDKEEGLDGPACNRGDAKHWLNCQTGFAFQMPGIGRSPLANTRHAQYILLRSRSHQQQLIHQTTHSLARFFLEVDANFKQYQVAKRLRPAAAERLEAQRACYEEGRITVDRFMDCISQYATAVATEAQCKTTYNNSIVALNEAKGTLLADENIVIAQAARPRQPMVSQPAKAKKDNQAKTTSLVPDQPGEPESPQPKAASPTACKTETICCEHKTETACGSASKTDAPDVQTASKSKTWTFSISIGGSHPLEIKGTISVADPAPPASPAH
jgi:outer membrane protein TolC